MTDARRNERPIPGRIARALFTALSAAALLGAAAPPKPRVVAQMYVWVQHYGERGGQLEDHLDEAFGATSRAGFTAVQGWLKWFATPAIASATATALASHHLSMPAGYVDGPMHDSRAGGTIDRIVDWAGRARQHGVDTVIMNPDARSDGAEKTGEELATQARSLNQLGARLQALGMSLAVHAHDKEMRSGAREWYSNLRTTDAARVGICLDVHWVYRGGQDPMEMLRAAGPRIRDLHLRNSREGIWLEELAGGDIDYAAVARTLRDSKYAGTYTVELAYERGTTKSRSVEEDLRRSRDFVRRTFGL
jgi:inosose dehydratase